MSIPKPQKTNFGSSPAGYIPGLGRGAVGFITRSDIGPSRLGAEAAAAAAPAGYVAGAGRGAGGNNDDHHDGDRGDYSESRYDPWSGYEGSLFANAGEYDEEDREADDTYDQVENFMDMRRKVRREKRLKVELERMRAEKPPISQQFADVKRGLAKMTADDWMNIPEIGNYSIKKEKRDKYVPVPDRIIEGGRRELETTTTLETSTNDSATPKNLSEFGEARGAVLSLKLDKISDSVKGQSTIDRTGYLTDLNSLPFAGVSGGDLDIGDMKKARLLLKSVIETNPKHAPGWIAAARLEELDGKLHTARSILAQGLEHCPESEDIWLEAARLEPLEKSKAVLAKAVTTVPNSAKIWLAAAGKETDEATKIKVLKRALEFVSTSERVWKALIELESEEGAKALLYRAVECIPDKLDMWLALAKLEDYANAQVILNRARQTLPTEASIWIHAAKLEETQGNEQNVETVIRRGLKILQKNGVQLKREDWLREAEVAEKNNNIMTCNAIINASADVEIDEEDREKTWLEDARHFTERKSFVTARALYKHAVNVYPHKQHLWIKLIEFEKTNGTRERVVETMKQAIEACKEEDIFWLMYAKYEWQRGDIDRAREILKEAVAVHKTKDSVYLAASKLERELGNHDNARQILQDASEVCKSPKIWMQRIQIERELHEESKAWDICEKSLKLFPTFPKLWMIAGQLLIQKKEYEKAKAYYEKGLEYNLKTSPQLWICHINLEELLGNFAKARGICDKAKNKIPKNSDLWYTSVKLEQNAKNPHGVVHMLSRGLQECQNNGELWALAIELEPKAQRKAKSLDAIKSCDNDPFVIVAVAKLFWKERKLEKARKWFERAIAINSDYGDAWIYYYRFEREFGKPLEVAEIVRNCNAADPHHGRLWVSISKQVDNWRLKPEQIMNIGASKIEHEFSMIE